ncbi:MAG: hypothetical protein LHV69_07990 [Elusimicrobia bacterium]|nr:hypothetical protein [Candidatus Obscuribacterium magneticum]
MRKQKGGEYEDQENRICNLSSWVLSSRFKSYAASDAELDKILTALKENRQEIQKQMEKFRDQKDSVLTLTQRAKMIMKRPMPPFGGQPGQHGAMGWDECRSPLGGHEKGPRFDRGQNRQCPFEKEPPMMEEYDR